MNPPSPRVFLVDLHYVVPLEAIDALGPSHAAYLERGYAEGVFLLSGRKNPRTGGIIIAYDTSREAIESRVATDPFVTEGGAQVSITEVWPTMSAPIDLRELIGTIGS